MSIEIKYAQATAADFPAILDLQSKNLFENLSPQQRSDGFLTVAFSEEMLAQVIADIAIVKAFTTEKLIGYRMAQTLEFNARFPLLAAIIKRFPTIDFESKKLSEYATFISGPVCIAQEYRGQGVHQGMFKQLLQIVRPQFEVGVTFIAASNPRSLAAAQNKLGMRIVDRIQFNAKDYAILAFSTGSNN